MNQITSKFKAIMFDIDGTLTELGSAEVPEFLKAKLRELHEMNVPMAICSGRHSAETILHRLDDVYPEKWTLIAENGACGYSFKDGWKEFYRVSWPSEIIDKDELAGILQSRFKFKKFLNNESTLIFSPFGADYDDIPELVQKCMDYFLKIKGLFNDLGLTGLRIHNSKIGVVIGPEDGDKDRGILEYSRFIGINDKKILCIGDQPCEGCNDEAFLNGRYGIPYTVGDKCGVAEQVFDCDGKVLKGPIGVIELLNRLW